MQGNVMRRAQSAGVQGVRDGKEKGPGPDRPEPQLATQSGETRQGEVRLQGAECLQAIRSLPEAQGLMRERSCETSHTKVAFAEVAA